MNLRTLRLNGQQITPWIEAIAELRINLFFDFPYLYDGSIHYERQYLQKYAENPSAFCALILDGDRVVGASTAVALDNADTEFQSPFLAQGMALERVYYFGESLLLAPYRGQGIGHQFFELREQAARQHQKNITAFCAVIRSPNHPHRPSNYQPLDPFWRARGYAPVDGMITQYTWRDRGDNDASDKPMQFWLKDLSL